MSYFFIAQIKINDNIEYQKYIDKSESVFSKYNGEYVVVDNNTEILEGDWKYERLVMIKFNSKEDFNAWYNSLEYQQILKHRLKAANCDSILVKDLKEFE
jgi:uncharacterized protein (DUF1330 family)